ncbi:MAG: S8 family serine peptidase [Bdellovibrionales bacterium]
MVRVNRVRVLLLVWTCLVVARCGTKEAELIEENVDPICRERVIHDQYIVKYSDDRGLQREDLTRDQLKQTLTKSHVEWVEPNYEIPAVVGDSLAASAVIHPNAARIGATYGWNRGYRGQGVRVAVVDSGVDWRQPLLASALRDPLGESTMAPRPNGIDEDNNGYPDDLYGWNFVGNTPQVRDESGHGTHIAGIIASSHEPGSQLAGIAPGVTLIVADFMENDHGDEYNAIRAIEYVLKRGARIVNNSWSNFCSYSIRNAFQSWQNLDVVFVNAAGNNGRWIDSLPIFPSNLNFMNMVTVGSVNRYGQRSSFSNYGANVLIYAPGEEVFSLGTYDMAPNALIARSGTSMSTAYVSGALALAWSAFPRKSARQLVSALHKSAEGDLHAQPVAIVNIPALLRALAQSTN